MVILLFVVLPLVMLAVGYFLWSAAMENYGYNIFNLGVLIRLLISLVLMFVDFYIGIAVLTIFSIWNFIVTWNNTSFFIALFAVLLQPVALLFSIDILNRIAKEYYD